MEQPILNDSTISAIRNKIGKTTHYLGVFTDLTAEQLSHKELIHLAYHDSLTGLPNRLLCIDRLNQALAHAKRHRKMVAVLFLDLDRFKTHQRPIWSYSWR